MRRVTCFVLLLAMLNSCAHWVEVPSPIDVALSPSKEPQRVRVLRRDSSRVELTSPIVTAEYLTGISTDTRRELVTIPRDSILQVQLSKVDGGGSALAVVGVLGFGLVLLAKALGDGFESIIESIRTCSAGTCR